MGLISGLLGNWDRWKILNAVVLALILLVVILIIWAATMLVDGDGGGVGSPGAGTLDPDVVLQIGAELQTPATHDFIADDIADISGVSIPANTAVFTKFGNDDNQPFGPTQIQYDGTDTTVIPVTLIVEPLTQTTDTVTSRVFTIDGDGAFAVGIMPTIDVYGSTKLDTPGSVFYLSDGTIISDGSTLATSGPVLDAGFPITLGFDGTHIYVFGNSEGLALVDPIPVPVVPSTPDLTLVAVLNTGNVPDSSTTLTFANPKYARSPIWDKTFGDGVSDPSIEGFRWTAPQDGSGTFFALSTPVMEVPALPDTSFTRLGQITFGGPPGAADLYAVGIAPSDMTDVSGGDLAALQKGVIAYTTDGRLFVDGIQFDNGLPTYNNVLTTIHIYSNGRAVSFYLEAPSTALEAKLVAGPIFMDDAMAPNGTTYSLAAFNIVEGLITASPPVIIFDFEPGHNKDELGEADAVLAQTWHTAPASNSMGTVTDLTVTSTVQDANARAVLATIPLVSTATGMVDLTQPLVRMDLSVTRDTPLTEWAVGVCRAGSDVTASTTTEPVFSDPAAYAVMLHSDGNVFQDGVKIVDPVLPGMGGTVPDDVTILWKGGTVWFYNNAAALPDRKLIAGPVHVSNAGGLDWRACAVTNIAHEASPPAVDAFTWRAVGTATIPAPEAPFALVSSTWTGETGTFDISATDTTVVNWTEDASPPGRVTSVATLVASDNKAYDFKVDSFNGELRLSLGTLGSASSEVVAFSNDGQILRRSSPSSVHIEEFGNPDVIEGDVIRIKVNSSKQATFERFRKDITSNPQDTWVKTSLNLDSDGYSVADGPLTSHTLVVSNQLDPLGPAEATTVLSEGQVTFL